VDADVQILAHRVDAVETTIREAINEIRDGIREIASNTGKLAVLEERHAETRDGLNRAFAEISRLQAGKCEQAACSSVKAAAQSLESRMESLEGRASAIEIALPPLKEARSWVVSGMVGIVAIIGLAVVALVVVR
jgi:chromosome segregation ATPase